MDEFRSIIQKGADATRIVNQNGELLLDLPDDESMADQKFYVVI